MDDVINRLFSARREKRMCALLIAHLFLFYNYGAQRADTLR